MDNERVGEDLVQLLSKILERPLEPEEVSPPIVFVAALIAVLWGVIVMDRAILEAEKQQLQKTLDAFFPPGSDRRDLANAIASGIAKHQIFLDPYCFLVLAAPLSESEKLLAICFGYQMSAADGDMDLRERLYLQSLARRFKIDADCAIAVETTFAQTGCANPEALQKARSLLTPDLFLPISPHLAEAAKAMQAQLSL